MDERYGVDRSQRIRDVQWIEEAALAGNILLAKDLRVAHNVLEATTIYQTAARAFALARRDVNGPTMIRYFLDNEQSIFRMARRVAGPYVFAVSREGLRRAKLNHL
jgi:hypothetical protein